MYIIVTVKERDHEFEREQWRECGRVQEKERGKRFFFNLKNNKAIAGELKRSQGCLEEAH